MSRKQKRRAELFEQFSTQLAIYDKRAAEGFVVCPHCGIILDRRSLNQSLPSQTRLTLAHVVPQSVGGRQMVLACACCNSGMGSLFEGDLSKLVRSIEAVSGNGETPITMTLPGVSSKVPAHLTRAADGDWMIEIGKCGINPEMLDEARAVFEQQLSQGLGWQISVPAGRLKRVQRAIAVAAHLKAYWGFGVEYLLSQSVRGLAQWIAPNDPESAPPIAFAAVPENWHLPRSEIIGLVTHDYGPMLAIPVLQPNPKGPAMMVLIPGPTTESVAAHAEMLSSNALKKMNWKGEARRYEMPGPSRFTDKAWLGSLHRIWQDVTGP